MRPLTTFILLSCLILGGCNKQGSAPGSGSNAAGSAGSGSGGSGAGGGSAGSSVRPASISVAVNGTPIAVTGISYDRSGSTDGDFNFSAWNPLQRVDVYCFWFYEQSGYNYQFSDSINYSTRPDTLTAWTTTRATNWGQVNFDCCVAPLADSVIPGEYSGNFLPANAANEKSVTGTQGLTITGNFYLLFGPSHPGH